jgi:hypothetical protein
MEVAGEYHSQGDLPPVEKGLEGPQPVLNFFGKEKY